MTHAKWLYPRWWLSCSEDVWRDEDLTRARFARHPGGDVYRVTEHIAVALCDRPLVDPDADGGGPLDLSHLLDHASGGRHCRSPVVANKEEGISDAFDNAQTVSIGCV